MEYQKFIKSKIKEKDIFSQILTRLDNIDNNITTINQRLSNLETKVENLEVKVENIDQRLKKIEQCPTIKKELSKI